MSRSPGFQRLSPSAQRRSRANGAMRSTCASESTGKSSSRWARTKAESGRPGGTRTESIRARRRRRPRSSRASSRRAPRTRRRGDRAFRACFDACWFGDESQQRVPPQVWQVLRWTHCAPIFMQSSHSSTFAVTTFSSAAMWAQAPGSFIGPPRRRPRRGTASGRIWQTCQATGARGGTPRPAASRSTSRGRYLCELSV